MRQWNRPWILPRTAIVPTALIVLAALAACTGEANRADTGGIAATPATPASESMTDANVVSTLAVINGGEVAAARVAEQRASSSEVKSFARQMATDHTTMQRDVDALARSSSIAPQPQPLADSLRNRMQAQHDSLTILTGPDLDRAYIQWQVDAHREALEVLNRLLTAAQSERLRDVIQRAIGDVRSHLERAQTLQSQLGSRSR